MGSTDVAAPRERPILMRGDLVQAILAGRKTVTRRPVKPDWWRCLDPSREDDRGRALRMCPYGAPGDRLWVRETWAEDYTQSALVTQGQEQHLIPMAAFVYRADGHKMSDAGTGWRPSIFMPRAACRLVLEIRRVDLERLHAVTLCDLQDEGMSGEAGAAFRAFSEGWSRLYRAKPELQWAANPWVWVLDFVPVNPVPVPGGSR